MQLKKVKSVLLNVKISLLHMLMIHIKLNDDLLIERRMSMING